MVKKTNIFSLLILLFLFFFTENHLVSAHAYITNSNPGENEILDSSPEQVNIEFNEKIQSGFYSLNVLNSSGEKVDKKDAKIDEETFRSMSVSLEDNLPNDVYTVEWRVVSADGHTVSGIIPFSIGDLPEGVSFPEQQQNGNLGTIISTLFNKVFLYTGFTLYMGILLFYLVWYRSDVLTERVKKRTRRFTRIALVLLSLSIISFLFIQTGSYAGSFINALNPRNLLETLTGTKEGFIWIIQVVLLVFLYISQSLLEKKDQYSLKRSWIIPCVAFIGIMLGKSFLGHPSSSLYEQVAITLNFLHMLAASIWLGGMIVIIIFLREGIFAKEGMGHDLYWSTVERYSIWALFSVAVLVLSGAINGSLLIPDFHSLVYTAYGITLLVKVGLLLIMLGFGSYHLINRKLLNKDDYYKKSIKWEMSLGVLVLIVTSIFTQLQTPTLPIDKPFYQEAALGYNENISVSISPKKTGIQNQFEVNVYNNKREPISSIEQITISLIKEDQETTITLEQDGEGHYTSSNLLLNQPGNWKIVVHVLTTELDSYDIPFETQVR